MNVFCTLPPEAFGLFNVLAECPVLCNTCPDSIEEPTLETCDDDDVMSQLATALGDGTPLSGVASCSDVASWCRGGADAVPHPDWAWVLSHIADDICKTTCGSGC